MKKLKRCLCLLLVMVALLGALPAFALSPTQTKIELSELDPAARQRIEFNLERYKNFIAADPNLFLHSKYIRQEWALLDDDQYEYVRNLALEITADCKTADEEIYAVAEYIAENIYYGGSKTHTNAYDVLTDGYALCSGFANAFNAMMQILGHPCVNVLGWDHEWNMVYNGNRWMLVDPTWSRTAGSEKGELVQGDGVNMEWYDFDLELTYEKYHYIDWLPYSVVDGILQAFPHRTDVTSFTIPDSVTNIGAAAFAFCESLTSVTISDSVTKIGANAFEDCTSLTHITIPDSVTEIGKNAFSGCYALTSIDLPDSITAIRDRTFEYSGLTEITIPDSVTSIGIGAFSDNLGLKSITIPKSVTEIGDQAFHRCNDLADVYYEGSEADWQKISIGSGNHNLTNAIIYFDTDADSKDEAGLSGEFGKDMAWNFTGGALTVSGSGEMPDYFYGTGVNPPWYDWSDRIESIVIKSGVTYVSKAFDYLDNVREVRIEEGVETIAWCAFHYCSSLETVTLPKSLKSIEFDAFDYCSSLKTVYYRGSEQQWNEIEWPTMEGNGGVDLPSSARVVFLGTDSESAEKIDTDPCAQGHKYTSQETEDTVVYTCSVCRDQYTETKKTAESSLDNFKKANSYISGTFGDVKTTDWFSGNVKTVYEYGLMNGTAASDFSPHQDITIAQAVTMAVRLHNIYYSQNASFSVSNGGTWYAPYVEYAENAGILNRPFNYDQTATREQFVYLLSRALPKEVLPDIRGTISFVDVHDITCDDEVELLVRAGIINGINAANGLCFFPQKSISRAEAAAVMSRMILPEMRSAS